MDESTFHRLADHWLATATDALEAADAEGALDADYQSGILTLTLASGKTFIVSKHTPSRQLWLSSPISGGLHFSHKNTIWSLEDGRSLSTILAQELQTLANIKVSL